MKKPSIIYFGTPDFSVVVLKRLLDEGYSIPLVVTTPDKPKGRKGKLTGSPVKIYAQSHHIPFITPLKLRENREVVDQLQKLKPDLIIVFSYGKIIPDEILAVPTLGPLNIHPSLLPKFRGPSPIQAQILAGETKTGVTIIKMAAQVDAGPIISQSTIPTPTEATFESLAHTLAHIGADMLIATIPKLSSKQLKPKRQDESHASFTKIIHKNDGFFEANTLAIHDRANFNRMVRAYYPWPSVWTNWQGKILKFLPENKVQLEGKSPISIKQFLSGHPEAKEWAEKLYSL